jgi:hypothetical protein
MKKSAVEYLVELLNNINNDFNSSFKEEIEQAKEMEKQQIIDFGNKMQLVKDIDFDGNIEFIFNPEQYYKETFKTK